MVVIVIVLVLLVVVEVVGVVVAVVEATIAIQMMGVQLTAYMILNLPYHKSIHNPLQSAIRSVCDRWCNHVATLPHRGGCSLPMPHSVSVSSQPCPHTSSMFC